MKSFSPPLCFFPAAVAHVHGGLQWSERAGSRESQLLKEEPGRQQRDSRRSLSTLATLPQCNTNTLPECYNLTISPDWIQRAAGLTLRMMPRVLRNNRMYVGRNVAGQMSARRDCYQLVATVMLLFFLQTANITDVVLFALAFYKTSHAVVFQHLVAMYYWQKMSFIMIWFHIIQIFVLFIYYIYY